MTDKEFSILRAIAAHPGLMSAVLLDHFIRGEVLGRMNEKGLLDSDYFGCLKGITWPESAQLIDGLYTSGLLQRAAGFYPALSLTHDGQRVLATAPVKV